MFYIQLFQIVIDIDNFLATYQPKSARKSSTIISISKPRNKQRPHKMPGNIQNRHRQKIIDIDLPLQVTKSTKPSGNSRRFIHLSPLENHRYRFSIASAKPNSMLTKFLARWQLHIARKLSISIFHCKYSNKQSPHKFLATLSPFNRQKIIKIDRQLQVFK